jgi:hypothetical protein
VTWNEATTLPLISGYNGKGKTEPKPLLKEISQFDHLQFQRIKLKILDIGGKV